LLLNADGSILENSSQAKLIDVFGLLEAIGVEDKAIAEAAAGDPIANVKLIEDPAKKSS
jgi:hypothetical protein